MNRAPPSQSKWRVALAAMLWLVAMAIIAAGAVFLFLNRATEVPPRWGFRGFQLYSAILGVTAGSFIAWRRPGNPIGWLLLASGFFAAVAGLMEEFATYALLTRRGSLPGGVLAAWFGSWLWVPSMGLIAIHTLLLFPDGRFLGPRWRLVAWMGWLWIALGSLFIALTPGPIVNFAIVDNPYGWHALPLATVEAGLERGSPWIWAVLAGGLLPMAGAIASLVLRFRRARGRLRQQIKWLALAAVFVPLAGIAGQFESLLVNLLVAACVTVPYAAIAAAILRYRLYDVDVVIRRTLSYTLLTVLLALVYFGAVLLLQNLFVTITGQRSPVAIVLSTLVIAALFSPLRTRIQAFIDRRFYRREYNARRALARFAASVRDEVEMEALMTELLHVVRTTLQPTHVSLWLQDPDES